MTDMLPESSGLSPSALPAVPRSLPEQASVGVSLAVRVAAGELDANVDTDVALLLAQERGHGDEPRHCRELEHGGSFDCRAVLTGHALLHLVSVAPSHRDPPYMLELQISR